MSEIPYVVLLYLTAGALIVLGSLSATLVVSKWDGARRSRTLAKTEELTEGPLLLLAVSILPILLIQFVANIGPRGDFVVEMALLVIWVIFAAELAVRVVLATDRISYILGHWFDVLIIAVPFTRPLRAARSARVVKAMRVGRSTPFLARLAQRGLEVLRERGLQYILLGAAVVVLIGAAIGLAFERQHSEINDYPTAVWWAVSTILTVGYGDVVPVTPEGKLVAALLMLIGIAVLAWSTASIAAFLVEWKEGRREATNNELMDKLELMERELRLLRKDVTRLRAQR